MRMILIEEDRFAEVSELLRAKAAELANHSNTAERMGWDAQIWKAAVNEAHRSIHCNFVRWAQSHGASCVPR